MSRILCRSVKLAVVLGLFVLLVSRSGMGQQQPSRKKAQPSDRAAAAAPDTVELLTDIAYREGNPKCRLDLAMPKARSDQPRAAIVFIHGGGWRSGDKALLGKLALPYAAQGYVCICVNYRLVDDAPFPACVEDVKCAVRWLRANAAKYHVDPQRIGAYGNSAGAHLVAMLGLVKREAGLEGDGPFQEQSSLVQAVCCSATPTDFIDWGGNGFRGESVFLAGPAESLDVRKKKASPLSYVRPDAPPFLVIHGRADTTVPFGQAERFVEALQRVGAKDVTFKTFDDAAHGVFAQNSEGTHPLMEAFFARTLKTPEAKQPEKVPEGQNDKCEQRDASAEEAWLRHGLSETQRTQIRAAFQRGIDQKFIPGGALLLIYHGEPVFREAFGLADLENGRPFTPDLPCRIASVTKPHTATLIAMLVEQGKVSWNDPIDKYLPHFAGMSVRGHGLASRPPKIREVLSHTAGFPDQKAIDSRKWRLNVSGTLADAVNDLPGQGLATEPGQVFAYTGMGFMVAGRIAEVVTGKEFAALMKEMLLDPIGATTATFYPSEELKRQMPTPYSRQDGAFAKPDLSARPRATATYPNPAGGLISTLDDVGRFLLLHRNRGVANGKRLISADSLAALYRAQPATGHDSYGLGFNVLKAGENGGGVRIHHIGASGTLAEADFENDLLIVLLTQVPQTETLPFRQGLIKTIYGVFQPKH